MHSARQARHSARHRQCDVVSRVGRSCVHHGPDDRCGWRLDPARKPSGARGLLQQSEAHMSAAASTAALLERRFRVLGKHSPLFYDKPLRLVRGEGVWLYDAAGKRYLDAYNNVPHVGHCHPRVVDALCQQARTLNTHTRYLDEMVVNYAERLLATFERSLTKVFFCCTGSEANELALRIARECTGNLGIIVTDFAYHGNTAAVAQISSVF